MPKYLVIVESPAKAKTIEKYLGKDFTVLASYGHIRDLIPKGGAVDTAHDFEMHYALVEKNARHVDAITKAMRHADVLYLATDPDREGEAIAWHLKTLLEERHALENKKVARVVFHQITKTAVIQAMETPRDVAMDLVDAQRARRALDYLVGFQLSPLLWKKVYPGLSAGRVQSPALRMIVERELEIERFVSQEYWSIHAVLNKANQSFHARLIQLHGQKLEQFSITNKTQADAAVATLQAQTHGSLTVSHVTQKERKRHPTAPFITSTLQQEAARKLGFSTTKTMQIAQQLYEGIDIGSEGQMGLITYMRTDSVNLATEAIEEIRVAIEQKYGATNLPAEARIFKTKSKNAQEAHEAIRPTSALRYPEAMKSYLEKDQARLYQLIWQRAISSQMIEATLHTVSVDFHVAEHIFRANGSTIVIPGFMAVYQESHDSQHEKNDEKDEKKDEKMLPHLVQGESVPLQTISGDQHFTEPPPRFTEASLVKALEEHDIGRPSTYASIIKTLQNRKYAELQNKRFKATDVGRVVNRFLTNYFTQYVDYDFTANLEDQLDAIARGDKTWIPLLKEFWQPFKDLIEYTEKNVQRSDVTQEKLEEKCPKCNAPLSTRLGKRGSFIGCTTYPTCDYTRNVGENTNTSQIVEDRVCPACQEPLVIKYGKYGKFIGCSAYPKCKHLEPLEKPRDTQVECPQCKKGHILERKSRHGKIFYSCANYPTCRYAMWNEPLHESCPTCHSPILSIKTTKKNGRTKVCPAENCKYSAPFPEAEPE